ncbi:hypothetical protein ACIO6T_30890 [Streptomyces sp. NPDC087532]|uniref:hypothetical protein n=1 Tax=Streptomyces sp. NPDC087532 TaxID=3365795 RepID=UPI0038152AD6
MPILVSAAPGQVTARWHQDVTDAPADSQRPAHPSRTRAWARAWQHLTTERVTDHRHLHLDDGTLSETVSFYLTPANGSPYWTSQETDADVAPVWPGPVLWAGSPHAEYGGAGTAGPAHARTAVTEGLRLAADLRACALVFPGVDTGQATLLTDTEHRAGVLNLATDVAFTRPLGTTLDHWWNGIPARHRREIRRQWRRGSEAGLTLAALTGSALQSALPRFASLANTTADRHGTRLYGADMFHHLATVPGTVLLTAQSSDGHLAGGLYCWLSRRLPVPVGLRTRLHPSRRPPHLHLADVRSRPLGHRSARPHHRRRTLELPGQAAPGLPRDGAAHRRPPHRSGQPRRARPDGAVEPTGHARRSVPQRQHPVVNTPTPHPGNDSAARARQHGTHTPIRTTTWEPR